MGTRAKLPGQRAVFCLGTGSVRHVVRTGRRGTEQTSCFRGFQKLFFLGQHGWEFLVKLFFWDSMFGMF